MKTLQLTSSAKKAINFVSKGCLLFCLGIMVCYALTPSEKEIYRQNIATFKELQVQQNEIADTCRDVTIPEAKETHDKLQAQIEANEVMLGLDQE